MQSTTDRITGGKHPDVEPKRPADTGFRRLILTAMPAREDRGLGFRRDSLRGNLSGISPMNAYTRDGSTNRAARTARSRGGAEAGPRRAYPPTLVESLLIRPHLCCQIEDFALLHTRRWVVCASKTSPGRREASAGGRVGGGNGQRDQTAITSGAHPRERPKHSRPKHSREWFCHAVCRSVRRSAD